MEPVNDLEFLSSRYNNVDSILRWDYKKGFKLLKKGYEKAQEKNLWDVWLARLPNMTKKNFVSFEEFKRKGIKQATTAVSNKSTAQIMEDAKRIRERDRRNRE